MTTLLVPVVSKYMYMYSNGPGKKFEPNP